jgi:hypothetical protein
MNQTQILGLIRHLLTFGGGLLVGKGILDEESAAQIIGATVTVIGGVWSAIAPEKK